mgnify:CR=1 FL=1
MATRAHLAWVDASIYIAIKVLYYYVVENMPRNAEARELRPTGRVESGYTLMGAAAASRLAGVPTLATHLAIMTGAAVL